MMLRRTNIIAAKEKSG